MLTPVFSNSHLTSELNNLENHSSNNIKSLIFLNCGGVINLTNKWFYKEHLDIKTYLFDAHRPYKHENMHDPLQKIFIVNDGCRSYAECPTLDDAKIFDQVKDLQSDSDEDDDEDEDLLDDSDDHENSVDENNEHENNIKGV